MSSRFTLSINGTPIELLSMDILVPRLFQVYYLENGAKMRAHMILSDSGDFVYARREDCPVFMLEIESSISDGIKDHYNLQ